MRRRFPLGSDFRSAASAASVVAVTPQTSALHPDVMTKLAQVEQNAWMLFSELPPCGAKTRALHVYLDAKALKAKLEKEPAKG